MLPCELIERNGDALARAVAETARRWSLPDAFLRWLDEACLFTNTLVDRIVTGYPKDEVTELSAQLGYQDDLLVTGEIFHSWVIESRRPLDGELPFAAAGLDVTWTADMTPYRERKVRILNGAHTMTVLAAYLAGKETVRECMDDPLIRSYMQHGIEQEILPTLSLPRADLEAFARSVTERFSNPFIKHYLLSISLNSVSKYKARILGTVLDYQRKQGRLPARLTFALAALFAFYRGRELRDGALIGRRDGTDYRIQDDAGGAGMLSRRLAGRGRQAVDRRLHRARAAGAGALGLLGPGPDRDAARASTSPSPATSPTSATPASAPRSNASPSKAGPPRWRRSGSSCRRRRGRRPADEGGEHDLQEGQDADVGGTQGLDAAAHAERQARAARRAGAPAPSNGAGPSNR